MKGDISDVNSTFDVKNAKYKNLGKICMYIVVVGGDHSRGRPEDSLFHSYNTEV